MSAQDFTDERGVVRLRGRYAGSGAPQTNLFVPARVAERYANVALTGGATIDGIAVVTGDRVLLVGQTDPKEDGLWVANTAGAWTRPDDFAAGTVVPNGALFVVGYAGGAWFASLWLLNTSDTTSPAVVGIDDFDDIDPIFQYAAENIVGGLAGNGPPALQLDSPVIYTAVFAEAGTPAQPVDGLTLFSDGGVLKYRTSDGTVHTVTATP